MNTEPKNNQEFYNGVDDLCLRLRGAGMSKEADRINHLLHKVAWTSTSELFRELEVTFEKILSAPNAIKLSDRLKEDLEGYIRLIANA